MNFKQICLISSLCFSSFSAYAVDLCGKAMQGEILIGHAPETSTIKFNQLEITPDSNGMFLLALERDQTPQNTLITDTAYLDLEVGATKWDIQNIKGIPPRKVTPSDSDLAAIEKEQKLVRKAQKNQTSEPFWEKGFIMPVEGRTSGKFGGQRIMNGVKKNPHSGMDIAAPEGTAVKSSGDGIVTLAYPDLFYSGNVIIIDHGYGLHTIYAHLKDIKVQRGDKVSQGDIIGTVGQTGRATGPHLHWGASAHGIKFNPTSLLDINTADEFCFTL